VSLWRAEAGVMAKAAIDAAASLPSKEAAKVYARHGYFLLQYHGAIPGALGSPSGASGADSDDDDDHGEGPAGGAGAASPAAPSDRTLGLQAAAASLERATALAPDAVLPWRHLGIAYTALKRLREAEAAAAQAVAAAARDPAAGGKAPWELHYRHAKALKRLDDTAGAAAKYCDALEAEPRADVALYWLRIVAGSPFFAGFPPALRARVTGLLAQHAERAAALPAVPHEYIRKLFDGYSRHFDEHLTQRLGYATPAALARLALAVAAEGGCGAAPLWDAAADLGCGTGLAGVEFRRFVRRLAGVDLSAGMVAEARARAGVYDAADVAEVEAWLAAQPAGAYDLVVCADVLVYIGALEGVFTGVARAMRPRRPASRGENALAAGGAGLGPHEGRRPPPPLFVVSTEAELEEAAATASANGAPARCGFRLAPTGRCVHARGYVLALAAANGFTPRSVTRQAIRRNAGEDVIGDLYVLEFVGLPPP
jgi:predicted TPR repeat methyltransferase